MVGCVKEVIFEIYSQDKIYKIYRDGRIEGFSNDAYVINWIPTKCDKPLKHGIFVNITE